MGLKLELSKNLPLNYSETNKVKKIEDIEKSIEFREKAFIYPDYKEEHLAWTAENFPREQVKKLISRVRNESENWLIHDQQRRDRREKDLVWETKQLNALLDQYQNLYILVIDIRLINYLRANTAIPEDTFWAANSFNIGAIRWALEELSGSVYGYSKAERDMRYGLNLHCILYFQYNPKFNEQKVIQTLKVKIKEKCPNLEYFEIRNWNNVIRKHYSPYAIGHIKKNNTKQIEAFQQWVLNYYLRINEYLWPKILPPFEMGVQQHFRQITVNTKAAKIAREKVQKHIKKNEIPILAVDEKSTWSTRHLSKNAKDRINLSKRYYRALDEASSKSLNYLEIFIETLLDSSFYAFDLRQDQSDISKLTVPVLEKALTRIGRQFISLSEHYVHIKDSLLYHQLFSEKINFQLILNFKQSVAAKSIKLKHLVDIDNHIAKLRDFLNLPLTQLAGQSIATHRLNQYKLYQDRIDTTNQYLKPLLKNDVKAFYVKFQLVFKYKKTQQSEFSELFTKFLHQAKRARPLYWMSGYWGFWREYQDTTPYAEIIFFLDNNAFNVRDDQILKWLKAEWESCLDKHCKPAMLMLVPEKIIRTKLEITHVFSERWRSWSATIEIAPNWSALIESVNKERQKKLLTESVPEFIVDCTFQEKPNNNIPKVLIKGNKPRKKQKVSKKDSSGTDEPQDT